MSTAANPANAGEALGMLESAMGYLADLDPAGLSAEVMAECLRGLERADAVGPPPGDGCWPGSMRPAAPWATGSGPAAPGCCTRPG